MNDSFALFKVLNQLDKDVCTLEGLDDPDPESRAAKMISNGTALGVPEIITPHDLMTNNTKINTLYVAQIFNTKHGLAPLTEEEYAAAAMLEDGEGTQEERAFRLWINSLGIEGVTV